MNYKINLSVVLVLLLLSATVSIASALSNSGGGDWSYYDIIAIKENSGETLTDYQVLLELSGGDFPTEAQTDGDDIRFIDASDAELSYWIEEFDYPGNHAKIWVKVPSIPASGETKLKMYYGNPSASAVSDGDNTFEFFDDFEDGDISDWSEKAGRVSWSASIDAAKDGTYGLKGHMDANSVENLVAPYSGENIAITSWFRLPDVGGTNVQSRILYGYADENNYYIINAVQTQVTKAVQIVKISGGSVAGDIRVPFTASGDTWYKMDIKAVKNSNLHFLVDIDGTNYIDWTDVSPLPAPNLVGVAAAMDIGTNMYWDTYRVRKYASPEPTVTISEPEPIISISTDKTSYNLGERVMVTLEINRSEEVPREMVLELELEESCNERDLLYESPTFEMPAVFQNEVSLPIRIPTSTWIVGGEYSFIATLRDPSTGDVIDRDTADFEINDDMPWNKLWINKLRIFLP